ncbi:MAG: hypothetical protein J6M48_09440 [Ruminococcus sp.]|nr:hypothetical protein [Ruminococcus sp.]
MKASALNKIESYDCEEHSIVQVSQKIRLDYAEQYDDDTGGITLGEEVSYFRIKEPKIRNIIAKFNGDRESFELFIKSFLSDYLHAAEVEKGSAEKEADE